MNPSKKQKLFKQIAPNNITNDMLLNIQEEIQKIKGKSFENK